MCERVCIYLIFVDVPVCRVGMGGKENVCVCSCLCVLV